MTTPVAPELVERVARACFEAAHYAGPIGDEPIEWGRGGYKTQVIMWEAVARAAISAIPDPALETGWIVSNASDTAWRTYVNGLPDWTTDQSQALRYARRVDAELAHAEDEDAWSIRRYTIEAGAHDRSEIDRLAGGG